MCGKDTGRTAVVKSGVERHAGAHAGPFHLSPLVDLGGDSIPAEGGDRSVDHWTDPSLVDGSCNAVDIDCCCGGLQVGVVLVQQLVPEAVARLQSGQSADMRFQEFKYLTSSGVVCGQHIQCLHQREQRPPVGPAPEEIGLPVGCLHPSVAEESFFLHEHLFTEKDDLSYNLIEIAALTGHCTHLGDGRDAHEHVIEPDTVHLRPFAGKGTVMEPILIVHDVVHVIGNNRFQFHPGIHL